MVIGQQRQDFLSFPHSAVLALQLSLMLRQCLVRHQLGTTGIVPVDPDSRWAGNHCLIDREERVGFAVMVTVPFLLPFATPFAVMAVPGPSSRLR